MTGEDVLRNNLSINRARLHAAKSPANGNRKEDRSCHRKPMPGPIPVPRRCFHCCALLQALVDRILQLSRRDIVGCWGAAEQKTRLTVLEPDWPAFAFST